MKTDAYQALEVKRAELVEARSQIVKLLIAMDKARVILDNIDDEKTIAEITKMLDDVYKLFDEVEKSAFDVAMK